MIVLFGLLLFVGSLAPAALMVELRDRDGSDGTLLAFIIGWLALTFAICLAAGGAL